MIEKTKQPRAEIRNLVKVYPGSQSAALKNISLSFAPGEFVVLLGPSGVGKSTLLRCINFLVRPTEGEVFVDGKNLANLNKSDLLAARSRIGMIFQEFNLVNRLSVMMNVMSGRLSHLSIIRSLTYCFPKEDHQRAIEALKRAGLEDFDLLQRRADRLSGGQKQRVAIARMLMQEPQLILADEPIASLDIVMRRQIMGLISDIAKRDKITVIMSLHQIEAARAHADRVVALSDGQVSFDGPPSKLTDSVIENIFKKKMTEIEEQEAREIGQQVVNG